MKGGFVRRWVFGSGLSVFSGLRYSLRCFPQDLESKFHILCWKKSAYKRFMDSNK